MEEKDFLMLDENKKYYRGSICLQKKAKDFYEVEGEPGLLIMRCLDRVTPDNDGSVVEEIPGKGKLCAKISSVLFRLLDGRFTDPHHGMPIKTHYIGISLTNPAECLVRRMAQAIPLEVIVRNRAYGSYVERTGVGKGKKLKSPVLEFTLKDDAHGDPLITPEQIKQAGIAIQPEIEYMSEVALAVNQIMGSFFDEIGLELADFKLVFGRQANIAGDYTNIRIIGELSPDVFRLRNKKTRRCLDKDIYRRGLPGLAKAYETVLRSMAEADKQRANERRNAIMMSPYSSEH